MQNNKREQKDLKRIDIATIRKQMVNKDGKQVEKRKIVFRAGVEIYYNGQLVDLGEYRNFFLKDANELLRDIDYAVEQGWKSEETAEKDRQIIEEKEVKLGLTVPLLPSKN